jgi:hypothetical protein
VDSLRFLRNLVGTGPARGYNFRLSKSFFETGGLRAYPSKIIVASRELGVCDGGHRLIVMKNDRAPLPRNVVLIYFAETGALGAGAPRGNPSALRSSSKSGQWMP